MATNMMGNTPARGGNDMKMGGDMPMGDGGMMGGEGGETSVTVMHVFLMEDGSFRVKEAAGEPVPEGAEPMKSLQDVMMRAEEYFAAEPEGEDPAMQSAKAGYAKAAKRPMMAAPNPGGVFGE